MEITWTMDAREEHYKRQVLAMGKAVAELRNFIRRKRTDKLSEAKLTYEELDNLLEQFIVAESKKML